MHKLSELNHGSFPLPHVLAMQPGQLLDWGRFVADVTAVRARLGESRNSSWALYHAETYAFAVGLMALLAEGKTVYLPAENSAGVSAGLRREGVDFLGQFPVDGCRGISPDGQGDSSPFRLRGSIVVYTSGSTGEAKPIPKSLGQLDRELLAQESRWSAGWQDPLVVGTVSHQHFYGLLFLLLWPLCAGRRFYYKPFVDPSTMAETGIDGGQAVWVMSPAHLHRLPADMPWKRARARVAAVFSSGGPLHYSAAQAVRQGLGQCPVEVLGSSETGGIAWRQQRTEAAAWQSLPGVDLRTSAEGALMVRSPWSGEQGWFTTADLASLAPDGTFSLGVRADRIVKLEGKRVALPEVETVLAEHRWIADAAVVPVSRQRQSLGAAVVLTEAGEAADRERGRKALTRELRRDLRARLSPAAIPRRWRILPELPRNSQGKVVAGVLADLFSAAQLPAVLRCETVGNRCHLELYVAAASPYFQGHFPDNPVLPGVTQLLWAQHFGRERLGVAGSFAGMKAVKFRQLVFPEQRLGLSMEYAAETGKLNFQFDSPDGRHSQGILLFEDGI